MCNSSRFSIDFASVSVSSALIRLSGRTVGGDSPLKDLLLKSFPLIVMEQSLNDIRNVPVRFRGPYPQLFCIRVGLSEVSDLFYF